MRSCVVSEVLSVERITKKNAGRMHAAILCASAKGLLHVRVLTPLLCKHLHGLILLMGKGIDYWQLRMDSIKGVSEKLKGKTTKSDSSDANESHKVMMIPVISAKTGAKVRMTMTMMNL
jgi:hypothetical protein